MTHMHSLASLAALLLAALAVSAFAADPAKPSKADAADASGDAHPKAELFHVVSLKFKPAATADQIKAVEKAFVALKDQISEIRSLKWGTNVSPEKHDKGFTHCFVLTFATDKDRDAYLVHDDHKAFGKVLGPVMADVMVVDFVAQH